MVLFGKSIISQICHVQRIRKTKLTKQSAIRMPRSEPIDETIDEIRKRFDKKPENLRITKSENHLMKNPGI